MYPFKKIKEELQKIIDISYYKTVDGTPYAGTRNLAYHKVLEVVEQIEKEYNNGWIPCSKRLPKENDFPEQRYRVLASCTDGIVRNTTIKSLLENKEKHSCNGEAFYYTAWQPLPDPYKEDEHDRY